MAYTPKTCATCGNTFVPTHPRSRYCSEGCLGEAVQASRVRYREREKAKANA